MNGMIGKREEGGYDGKKMKRDEGEKGKSMKKNKWGKLNYVVTVASEGKSKGKEWEEKSLIWKLFSSEWGK